MTGFVITSYVAYLLSKGKLNKMMSSYQVFRNTLIHLSKLKVLFSKYGQLLRY